LNYVLSYSYVELYIREKYKEQKPTAEEKQWGDLLQVYGYGNTDEVDRLVGSFVETGYLDAAAFAPELEKKNEAARAQKGEHSYARAWDLYGNSFDDNEEEFIRELVATVRSNIAHLSVHNLQSTAGVLRDLGRDALAESLIGEYFDAHAGDANLIKVLHGSFMHRVTDPLLEKRLQAAWQAVTDKRTLADVIKELSGRNGWSPDDIEILASHGADDYYDFFKSENSDMLYHYVRTCQRFGDIANPDEKYVDIARKANEALKRLAAESRINRLRVTALYKVELEKSDSGDIRADATKEGQ
jgi:hypothetical protein